MRILVVEDDFLVADAIRRGLCMSGFAVDCASDAEQAAAALAAEHFDLALLDIALPGADGLTFLRRLRNAGTHLPVMILTARETLATKVQALDLGADDFLVKPFEQTELAARCRALIRRSNLRSSGQLTLGKLRIDITGRQLYIENEPVELTGTEFELLAMLARSPQKVFHRDEILNRLRGQDADLYTRAVDILVSRLRRKLEPLDCIKTLRNAGYAFAGGHA